MDLHPDWTFDAQESAATLAAQLSAPTACLGAWGWLVMGSACLATFVASVMAEEQDKRLRNGTFGAIAGGAVGGVAALITKQDVLLLLGFVGSASGATLGWLTSVLLSLWAATTSTGRTVLEYQVGGWAAVREKLDIEASAPLFAALREWGRDYGRRVTRQKEGVRALRPGPMTNEFIQLTLAGWIDSFSDMLGLLFKLAKRPGYTSRVTIIVFGMRGDEAVGRHWIYDSGGLGEHRRNREFDRQSIGYKVLLGQIASPYFTTAVDAKNMGQDRDDPRYRPFLTFKLNDAAILALDWPGSLKEGDPYIVLTRELFQDDIGPAIRDLLAHWHDPLAAAVGLAPLPAPPPPALPAPQP